MDYLITKKNFIKLELNPYFSTVTGSRNNFIANVDPKITPKDLGLKITEHLKAEIKRYEELILTTDMGKKMKEIGDKYGT